MKRRTAGIAGRYIAPALARIESVRMAGMADHPHTIDRWDDATGENLIEQIAAVGEYICRVGDLPRGGASAGLTPKSRFAIGRGCSRRAGGTSRPQRASAPYPIRSASCGTIWERRSAMAAARTTANANATTSMP